MANGNTTAKIGFEVLMYDGEPFDGKMTRLTREPSEVFQRSHELEAEIKRRLGRLGMR